MVYILEELRWISLNVGKYAELILSFLKASEKVSPMFVAQQSRRFVAYVNAFECFNASLHQNYKNLRVEFYWFVTRVHDIHV